MSTSHNEQQDNKPLFKLNYLTVLLMLVVMVPILFFVVTKSGNQEGSINPDKKEINTLQAAQQATVTNPNYTTFLNLSLQYYNAKLYQECITACTKAIAFNPNGDAAYNNIGAAYGVLGNYEKEIEACQKAILINPTNQLAKNNLAWAIQQLEKTKRDTLVTKK